MAGNSNREIAVQFNSVSFSYGETTVLENASFHIHRGEFAALVGPNGSGKTTVLKLILGLEQPTSGKVLLFGTNTGHDAALLHRRNRQNFSGRGRTGYVPQQPPSDQSFPVTVSDVVRMGLLHASQRYGTDAPQAVMRAMEQTGIADLAKRTWQALSGGQRRRVLVARALAAQPELLVLDEPTANMDTQSETGLFDILGKLKGIATILIVTHDMNFVSVLTDRVLCLGDNTHGFGNIVQHKTELVENSQSRHDTACSSEARVLHRENISPDDCCGN